MPNDVVSVNAVLLHQIPHQFHGAVKNGVREIPCGVVGVNHFPRAAGGTDFYTNTVPVRYDAVERTAQTARVALPANRPTVAIANVGVVLDDVRVVCDEVGAPAAGGILEPVGGIGGGSAPGGHARREVKRDVSDVPPLGDRRVMRVRPSRDFHQRRLLPEFGAAIAEPRFPPDAEAEIPGRPPKRK